jgi:serpin B
MKPLAKDCPALLALVPIVALALSNELRSQEVKSVHELVEGNGQFAFDLYGHVRQREGNLFFSPYSISTALGMVYAGARQETAAEISKVFHFSSESAALSRDFAGLQAEFKSSSGDGQWQLDNANALWLQKGYPVLPAFKRLLQDDYQAACEEIDFNGAPEQARQKVNGWVSGRTHGKISEILDPGTLEPDTRMVITNAIYFKAGWRKPFKAQDTKEGDFELASASKVRVPMMHVTTLLPCLSRPDFQALEMPYVGNLSMIVLLPKHASGLGKLEELLSQAQLHDIASHLLIRDVEVTFPKFKTTIGMDLKPVLSEMGMPQAFSRAANFSGMTSSERLAIGAVLHKGYVDVNEKGTEAAAATGAVMMPTAMRIETPKVTFRADHPFIFLIRDRQTESILFLGRMTDPRS